LSQCSSQIVFNIKIDGQQREVLTAAMVRQTRSGKCTTRTYLPRLPAHQCLFAVHCRLQLLASAFGAHQC